MDLRNQGTGVLRAVALGRRWGGPWTFVLKVDFLLKLEDVGLWKRYAPVLQRARYMLADPGEMVDEVANALARLLGGDGAAFTNTIFFWCSWIEDGHSDCFATG